jgi:hypothetical protein
MSRVPFTISPSDCPLRTTGIPSTRISMGQHNRTPLVVLWEGRSDRAHRPMHLSIRSASRIAQSDLSAIKASRFCWHASPTPLSKLPCWSRHQPAKIARMRAQKSQVTSTSKASLPSCWKRAVLVEQFWLSNSGGFERIGRSGTTPVLPFWRYFCMGGDSPETCVFALPLRSAYRFTHHAHFGELLVVCEI